MQAAPARPFRFGVVAAPPGDGAAWRALARRIADLGYTSLLMPDGLQLLEPFPSLAVAATAADLTVGTFVLAAPLRPPRAAAWAAHSMSVLTGGRFEFGLGTGRPGVADFAAQLGLPYGTAAERREQVRAAVTAVRELDAADRRTPVLMAASGPRARALAGELADIVTLATGARTPRDEVTALLADVRMQAGERAESIEFMTNLFVVGDDVPAHVQRYLGADLAALRAADSPALLHGSVASMADELRRRRDATGTSYVTVNAEYVDQLAPVIARLAGQ